MLVLVLHFALCFWCKFCMLHIVLELVGLTIRVSGPLLIGWMNPTKSKLRYLEAMPEQLIGVTRSVNIKFVIKGPEGGLGSRSLLWFLPRFPAPILVRFFLASEYPMWRIRARLALYCMSWGIQPPLRVVCLVWVRNKDSAGYRGTLHDSPNRCCVLSFLFSVNSTERIFLTYI